jgi:hypothetical protein
MCDIAIEAATSVSSLQMFVRTNILGTSFDIVQKSNYVYSQLWGCC